MNRPLSKWVDTNDLRANYAAKDFVFDNGAKKVCLVGSCRILPYLNFFRVYNHFSGHPFELICLNPVECWTPGAPVADGVNNVMQGYNIGEVEWLICEHIENCGALNTVEEAGQNVFKSLGCKPKNPVIRIPNWIYMFIYDLELAHIDKAYADLVGDERIYALRKRTEDCKNRFVGYCKATGLEGLDSWVHRSWLSTRMGWTGSHASSALAGKIFKLIAGVMGLNITQQIDRHEHFTLDHFASTGTKLTGIDYDANFWEF